MREQILENILSLYKDHMVTAIVFLALIVLAIAVSVGVIKLGVLTTPKEKCLLISTVIVCSAILIISQIVTIMPIYKDYLDSSFVVIERATMVVKNDSNGVLDRSSTVYVTTQDKNYELRMQTDLSLDVNAEYFGTVAFLKNSKYIVWYQFE